jgi:hypothetical protein
VDGAPGARRAAHSRLLRPRNWTPYRDDLDAPSPLARARLRSRFDAEAALRTDIGRPERRFRVGARAVSALTYVLSSANALRRGFIAR